MMRHLALGALVITGLAGSALAGEAKSYQVTGPVTDVAADSITVQKGKELWQIGKAADTKGAADVKKGDKVTVYYRMVATEVETKGAPAANAPATKKK
jgi:hypothetical protein